MPARSDEPLIQLGTRIPKELQRRLRVHCIESETTVMGFTVAAIREQLERKGARRRGGSSA
ncbi:MAG TPA: hypothetical protein VK672_07530 [Solirubrobacteraceae bacterium]|nr:hypothetical protein [Solirubrobacteraceae bacterium]